MATEYNFASTSDVDEFEAGLNAFLDGRMPEERFTPFRLQLGVYGQRQDGVQMVRVKLPLLLALLALIVCGTDQVLVHRLFLTVSL